jgi:hypothetical protein
MLRKRFLWFIVWIVAFPCAASLFAHGQVWDFMGGTQIDGTRDHDTIQVTRHESLFSEIQLRVSDSTIFFDRIIIHFSDGSSALVPVGDRISSEGKNYVIDIPRKGHVVESVEVWYYKTAWEHTPRLSLYGTIS